MSEHPSWVVDEILGAATRRHHPAWLRVAAGRVVEAGGSLATFGLDSSVVGSRADTALPVLSGLEALEEAVRFESVELEPGRSADVAVLPRGGDLLVLLLDRSAEVAERRIAQQFSNEIGLMRDELARRATPPPARETSLEPTPVAIVAVAFRGLAELVRSSDERKAARVAGLLVRAAARPLIDDGGRIGPLEGDVLTAVFGLLPTALELERLGVTAAIRALTSVEEAAMSTSEASGVRAAVGVAVGPALAGTLATRSFQVAATIGDAARAARNLASLAPAGTVAVERATLAACRDLATTFEPLGGQDDLMVHRPPKAKRKEVVQ